eukprot:TRINITY_DN412_c0_g1_i10.p1 TRINITY_DN412_c0_g1~~TRINITY_DN412_c0_g1_i10.p1  ORF type:complete len:178 (-),score=33.44 TRINITY_DN412_c0_g1_i10:44-577(-)
MVPMLKSGGQLPRKALRVLPHWMQDTTEKASTFALYALPFCVSKPNPAFLITMSFLGNAYPVVESHTDKECSLLGKAIHGGYQSNYVLTTQDGNISEDPLSAKTFFDEAVLGGESQVVPLYLIILDSTQKNKLLKIMKRTKGRERRVKDERKEPELLVDSKSHSNTFKLKKLTKSKK